jgi:putative transposase
MNCPHCAATTSRKRAKKTKLGYTTFFCLQCKRTFNERTGTSFNFLEFPTDIVLLAVVWRLRYKLSLRDVAEMFLERGFSFTHEAIRDWKARFAPLIADQLRTKRRGQAGTSWYVAETYLKVHGKWCYLYRASDHDGNLVDSMLSEKRNMEAAQRFFQQAVAVVGHTPESVTTDGHRSYPRAISETMGNKVQHRTSKYLNNRLEQKKITGVSNNATIPCMVLELSKRRHVLVVHLTNCTTTSVRAAAWEKRFHSLNDDRLSMVDLSPY